MNIDTRATCSQQERELCDTPGAVHSELYTNMCAHVYIYFTNMYVHLCIHTHTCLQHVYKMDTTCIHHVVHMHQTHTMLYAYKTHTIQNTHT